MSQYLFVPDRFDSLLRHSNEAQRSSIVEPVSDAIDVVKQKSLESRASRRGAFLILRGDSGSGKSTFLHTLDIFLEGVYTTSIERSTTISAELESIGPHQHELRILVIEGREALRDVGPEQFEADVHAINAFLRSSSGERTLVVWPANADDMVEALEHAARRVGGDALLGTANPSFHFVGPPKTSFVRIAERTVATLNQGASLADMGVSAVRAEELTADAPTVGKYLGLLRDDLVKNQEEVRGLLDKERFHLWIVVAAGNDVEGDVAALTRGTGSAVDLDALMNATRANIVQELKNHPDKLGILGTVLDARILHYPVLTALSVARQYGDKKLHDAMRGEGASTSSSGDAADRLADSDLARAVNSTPSGPRRRGPKPGSNTIEAFERLARIASRDDGLLNRAVGRGLVETGLATDFETEVDLGLGLTRFSDLACDTQLGRVRLELMWRRTTGRAEIANYVLNKLANYGKAIGFLS